jgi:hypothetical protein
LAEPLKVAPVRRSQFFCVVASSEDILMAADAQNGDEKVSEFGRPPSSAQNAIVREHPIGELVVATIAAAVLAKMWF